MKKRDPWGGRSTSRYLPETDPEIIQILELGFKGFKISIINISKKIEDKMDRRDESMYKFHRQLESVFFKKQQINVLEISKFKCPKLRIQQICLMIVKMFLIQEFC